MWREGWAGDVAKAKVPVRPMRRKPTDLRRLILSVEGEYLLPALLGHDQEKMYRELEEDAWSDRRKYRNSIVAIARGIAS